MSLVRMSKTMLREADTINVLTATTSHEFFLRNPEKDINIKIENSFVTLKIHGTNMYMEITGRKSIDKLESLLFEIFSLLFIYLGAYPKIESITANKENKDITNLLVKYNTHTIYRKESFCLCDINSTTINESVLKKYRKINRIPISTLQYIVSEDYKSVITNHKITLMLHIIEGLVDRNLLPSLKQELQRKMNKKDIGDFMAATYHICKSFFFNYHRKYKFDILSLLKVNQNKFLRILSDTRNWYSHYLKETQKPERLVDGVDIVIYFKIIYYVIRLFIMDAIQVKCDYGRVSEYFYIMHDWILEVKYAKSDPLKSNTYNINRAMKEFSEFMKSMSMH